MDKGWSMEISSPAFKNGERIPEKYSCGGDGVNPALAISGVPEKAKTLVIIMDDPDAPMGTFIHWLVWNIKPGTKTIAEGAGGIGVEGITTAGEIGYIPPCPPRGSVHTYRFKVYALDTKLALEPGSDIGHLQAAMEGHVIERAELDGKYGR